MLVLVLLLSRLRPEMMRGIYDGLLVLLWVWLVADNNEPTVVGSVGFGSELGWRIGNVVIRRGCLGDESGTLRIRHAA